MNNNLKQALTKMFSYSPYEFSEDFVKQKEWFWKHTWTEREQQEYTEWLIDFLGKNWRGIMERRTKPTKREKEKAANEFVLWYGWKTDYK